MLKQSWKFTRPKASCRHVAQSFVLGFARTLAHDSCILYMSQETFKLRDETQTSLLIGRSPGDVQKGISKKRQHCKAHDVTSVPWRSLRLCVVCEHIKCACEPVGTNKI